MKADGTEGLLRDLTPRALGAVVRRYGHFADAEDAVQEALMTASTIWPTEGTPANPLGWLIRVASRRMSEQFRRDEARRRREVLAASWSRSYPEPGSAHDDTLTLILMCCHPDLTPASAIPLTLRAVGGLTTREIASAFLLPEATLAQRISRAKAQIKKSDNRFAPGSAETLAERLPSVLHVIYLLFNEGYASSSGPDLARTDLSTEAIRLARLLHSALPDHAETAGLFALMVLTEARRPARTSPDGELVPLSEQDRGLWNRVMIAEGIAILTAALRRGEVGEYQAQAAIAAVHDKAVRYGETDWSEILSLYGLLEEMTDNPIVTLNRAAAAGMAREPSHGLALLEGLDDRLGDHHRLHAVRAHLLELAGDPESAIVEFRTAAAGSRNVRERNYLTIKAARLGAAQQAPPPQ